ncbi:MAG: isochorismatase family protein [Bifidobacteriaceae bacterium]|nr:isochorismatase family protein [Bifidobacteriaceae bacterium]
MRLQRNAALLIIDVQKAFEGRLWGARNNPQAEHNIASLAKMWRDTGRPIIGVRHTSRNPASPFSKLSPARAFKDIVADAPFAVVVEKSVNSAFIGSPDLHEWLQANHVRQLVITGIQTNMCVETTARVAGNLGYRVIVALDATHTFDIKRPDGTVLDAGAISRMTEANLTAGGFAKVKATAEIMGAFVGDPSPLGGKPDIPQSETAAPTGDERGETGMTNQVLVATGLTKRYPNSDVDSLADIDLTVRRGEFVSIMGSSGAGKSTLLYCLSGMEVASAGSIRLEGQAIERLSDSELSLLHRRTGFVFQQINLLSHLSLLENVALPGLMEPGKNQRKTAFRLAATILGRVGLTSAMHRLPAQTSGGEQQRAAIARALMRDPAVLFADEPTGSLHSAAGSAILDLIGETNRNGQTVIMVTHDPRAAARADRVVYLHDGRIAGERLLADTPASERESRLSEWLTSLGW